MDDDGDFSPPPPPAKKRATSTDSAMEEDQESTPVAREAAEAVNIEEEEDEVVREIDVFISRLDEDDQLYILQSPLRPNWRPYKVAENKEVKMNVTNLEMEVALESMDINSKNHDKDAPEQTLSSTRTGCTTGYATGILIGNELHLTPISEILQFRPSLKHIDDFEAQKSKNTTPEIVESDKPWVSLKYNSKGSEISRKYLKKMTAQKMTALNDLSTMGPSEYLASLCPGATVEGKIRKPSSSFFPSLPLEKRLEKWLHEGCQVNRFNALLHLDLAVSEEVFLKMLEGLAYLVQGLWVSKSSLIYGGDEEQIRDYILFLFSQNLVIKKRKLEELEVNDSALRQLLIPLAYERELFDDWKFIEECDFTFIKQHPEIHKQQECAWKLRGARLENFTIERKAQPVGRAESTTQLSEDKNFLRQALLHILSDRRAHSLSWIYQELRKTFSTTSSTAMAARAGFLPDVQSMLGEVIVRVDDVYVLRSGENPALDRFRKVILDLFREKGSNAMLDRIEIEKAVKERLDEDIPNNEYNHVVDDLCISYEGGWILRRGEE